jgi:hypothetical protein
MTTASLWRMTKNMTVEQVVRLLRAKTSELENLAKARMESSTPLSYEFGCLSADIALIASFLADFTENAESRLRLYEAHTENLIERVYALEGGESYPVPSWPLENQ